MKINNVLLVSILAFRALFSDTWYGAESDLRFEGTFQYATTNGNGLIFVAIERYDAVGTVVFPSYLLSESDQIFVNDYIAAKRKTEYAIARAEKNLTKNFLHKNREIEIFQVLEYGVLANLFESRYNPVTDRYEKYRSNVDIYVYGDFSNTVSDRELYHGPLYWAGTFNYKSKDGRDRTIKAYAVDEQTAKNVWVNSILPDDFRLPKRADYRGIVAHGRNSSETKTGFGSGFAISKDGYIVTNAHVVNDADRILVYFKDEPLEAKTTLTDNKTDLAIIKVNSDLQPLYLDSDRSPKVGDEIFVCGFPNPDMQGRNPKLTNGIISSKTGLTDDPTSFQISAPIQPGNSGSPLLNEDYMCIGVVNSKLDDAFSMLYSGSIPQGVNFAVKLDYLNALISQNPKIENSVSKVGKPFLGGDLEEVINRSIYLIETHFTENQRSVERNKHDRGVDDDIKSFYPTPKQSIFLDDHKCEIPQTYLFKAADEIVPLIRKRKEEKRERERKIAEAKQRARSLDELAQGLRTGMTPEEVRKAMGGKEPDEKTMVKGRLWERYGNTNFRYYPDRVDSNGTVTRWEIETIERP